MDGYTPVSSFVNAYRFTLAIAALQWFSIALRARKAHPAARSPASRSSSDLYWFLPVLAWGVESTIRVAKWFVGVEGVYWAYEVFGQAVASTILLVCLLGSSIAAERTCRSVGLPARSGQATVPLPILAAVLSVWLVWATAFLAVSPMSPRWPSEPRLGERLPCYPEVPYDVGPTVAGLGCSFIVGRITFFVATRDPDRPVTDYIETTDPGFVTSEGIRIGSTLSEALKAGGTRPQTSDVWACSSTLRSGWHARFTLPASAGATPGASRAVAEKEQVRRLYVRR